MSAILRLRRPPIKLRSGVMGQERIRALQQAASLFNQFVGAGVALLGKLALTVAQNLGIAAERIHDCGRDEFDTRRTAQVLMHEQPDRPK